LYFSRRRETGSDAARQPDVEFIAAGLVGALVHIFLAAGHLLDVAATAEASGAGQVILLSRLRPIDAPRGERN